MPPEPDRGPDDAAAAEPASRTADPSGLELARSVAERIAANGSRSRARVRRPGRTGDAAPGAPGRPAGRGSRDSRGTARVGGLATPAPFTGPATDDNDPALVGSALQELLAVRGWEQDAGAWLVLAGWADLVGRQTADHCQPSGLTDGALRVRADSSAWATQLRLLAPRIISLVNQRVGSTVVTSLVVDGPVAPSWRHGRLGVPGGRGPRDTYG